MQKSARTADLVRQRRLEAGLTQQVLATQAGIALRTLMRIEAGEDVRLSTLQDLAGVLGVPVSALVGEPVA